MVMNVSLPDLKLPELDARTLAQFLSAAADLTLIISADDIIADVSHGLRDEAAASVSTWRGLSIASVVQPAELPALQAFLSAARAGKPQKRVDLSHALAGAGDFPVRYSAFRVDGGDRIVLVGRDLRPMADLQSQLLESRQALEQNARKRERSEAQYRLLFETAAEAMVVVDPQTGRIRDANPRAATLLGHTAAALSGRKLASLFARARQAAILAALSQTLASGLKTVLPALPDVDPKTGTGALGIEVELFRAGDLKLVLVRLVTALSPDTEAGFEDARLADLVRNAAEAVLLTDEDGVVTFANEAFLSLAGLALAAQAVGRRLETFFRWNGIEETVLLANIRRHGRLPMFSATVKGTNGQASEVELSAVSRGEGAQHGFGFVMRPVGDKERRSSGRGNSDLTRAAESLAEMVGQVPMKDMVRDTTDVIERMCIEAALKLTGNNRASAARILGLSRQALYLKLARFGLADDGEE